MIEDFLCFIIMFVLTSYLSSSRFSPDIVYRNLKRRWLLKNSYIERDKIVYGVPHYDFFDHESRAYLSNLISIECRDKKRYAYDFGMSFEDNCKVFPKMREIKSFIDYCPAFRDLNIDNVVKNVLADRICNDDREVMIIDRIFKSRKDEKSEMEAGTLRIEMIRTDSRTLSLIDEMYKFLSEQNLDALEMNFKANRTKDFEDRDRYDIQCFLTRMKINGFVLNIKDNKVVVLAVDVNHDFSFSIDVDSEIMNRYAGNSRMDGEVMKEIVEDHIDRRFNLNGNGKSRFTDVAISYLDGVNLELMGCVIFEDICLNRFDKVEITDSYEQFRKMTDSVEGCYRKEFAYLYMWSLSRKIKHNHL